jgi:amidohydrolase
MVRIPLRQRRTQVNNITKSRQGIATKNNKKMKHKTLPVPPLLVEKIKTIRQDLHKHPELGFEEFRTSTLVANYLRKLPNVEVHTGIGKTGVIGVLKSESPGPCIALRADMDALPIEETNEVPYRSTSSGIMHACGHDGHTAALLGAATLLAENKSCFSGQVVFVFQPAEEGLGGAKVVCNTGILESLKVKSIFGLHGWPGVEAGVVCVSENSTMAASDGFFLTISGSGVHASTPHLGKDPFYVLGHLILGLQGIPSRIIDAQESVVISIGSVHGGTMGNIIPETVTVRGTIRTLKHSVRTDVLSAMKEMVSGMATTFGVSISIDCSNGYPPVINTSNERDVVRRAATTLGDLLYPFRPVMAGEDFSYYLEQFPGAFWFLGLGNCPQLHNSNFDFNDQVLEKAIKMHCQIVLESNN